MKRRKLGDKMSHAEHRLMGSQAGIGNSQGMKSNNSIFRIKSYHPYTQTIGDKNQDIIVTKHYGDKIRVFAKCIVGGRAGDMVDIMLMTQSS